VTAIVADASALVEYLLGTEAGASVAKRVEEPANDLHTPSLCDVEVVAALRGLVAAKKLPAARALEAIVDYADLAITRHGHVALLERTFELRSNFSAYDAAYVALSEALRARLLTCDAALARAVRAGVPGVEIVALG